MAVKMANSGPHETKSLFTLRFMWRLLVIDDDRAMANLLADFMAAEGFHTHFCVRGDEALERIEVGQFDIAVLDVMLPGMGGFEVLRRLRAAEVKLPIVMLTARGEITDRIVGLELGADDYLAKPFDPRELAARLRAVLRRQGATTIPTNASSEATLAPFRVDDVEVDGAARVAWRNGELLNLTGAEFDILQVFLRNAGQVLTRDMLSREALGRGWTVYDRSVDMHVSNLRKKLGPLADGRERLQNIRGAGYVYVRTTQAKDD